MSALFFAGEKKIWKEAFLDSRRRKTSSFAFAEDGIVKDTNSSQKISTHLLTAEVDFCPVLCVLEVPVLQAFQGISHFVWYCKAVSDLS